MNNFYNDLLIEIQENIKKSNFKKALELIEEELKMPYVPINVEEKLLGFRNKIFVEHFNNSEVKEISLQKYLDIFESDEVSNIEKYEMIEVFSEFNLKEYLEYIQNSILFNLKIDKFVKYKLLMEFYNQGFRDFISLKLNNKQMTFNLNEIRSFVENEQFIYNSSKIQDLVFKEVNILNNSLDILEKLFLVMTFEKELFEEGDIWKEIIYVISKLLNRGDIQKIILDKVEEMSKFELNIKKILDILQFE